MDGYECGSTILKRHWPTPQRRDCRETAEHAARRGHAERDDNGGLHDRSLEILLPAAAVDLVSVGPLVQPPLAAHLMLEVLDRIGNKYLLAAMPASASALSSRRPAGPTNGWPARSS